MSKRMSQQPEQRLRDTPLFLGEPRGRQVVDRQKYFRQSSRLQPAGDRLENLSVFIGDIEAQKPWLERLPPVRRLCEQQMQQGPPVCKIFGASFGRIEAPGPD